MKKTAYLIILFLMLAICLSVTIFLFYYLTKEENRTSVFTFSWLFFCFLEILVFGHFALISLSKLHSGPIKITTSIITGVYFILISTAIIKFNLITKHVFTPKTFFTTIVVISAIFLLIYGMLALVDINLRWSNKVNKQNRLFLQSILQEFEILQDRFERIARSKNLLEKSESGFNSSLEKLCAMIRYLPPSYLKDERILNSVKICEENLQDAINVLETAEPPTDLNTKNRIDQLASDLILKTESSRKIWLTKTWHQ